MNSSNQYRTTNLGPKDDGPAQPHGTTAVRPLRTWPALVLIALMLLARFGPGFIEGGKSNYWYIAVIGPLLFSLLMLIWWLTASRATWRERLLGFLGLLACLALTTILVDPSMRGPGTTYLTVPMGFIAFGLGARYFRHQRPTLRTGAALLLALAGFAVSLLFRNEGMTGDYALRLQWRWEPTPEETMLTHRPPPTPIQPQNADTAIADLALANPEWPGFRGGDRAGRSDGPPISTNWTAHPPPQLWKISVGPAWSSFAVAGKRLFTQEQRGPMETVDCYDADSGQEIWSQQVQTRFDDPLGGPGPRATPTLADGALFVTGATGVCLRLNPVTGEIAWRQDLQEVAGREAPMWGFAASPLVVGPVVMIHAGGPGDKGLLAFDVETGALRWSAAAGDHTYSSPQLNTIANEQLVLMLSNHGLLFLDPATGRERLHYEWKYMNYRALQPHLAAEDTVLLPSGMNSGTRAIRVVQTNGQLAAEELWTARSLKPDFTDFVSHHGFLYGVDAGIFTCVDLKTGERKWKGGRYGKGQVLLLERSNLLLVAAEDGRAVLLQANPQAHTEVDSFNALEGKTWNHPVVVGDRLYLRNSQEAAAYQLPLAAAARGEAEPPPP